MEKNKKITIFSTFTQDKIIDKKGGLISSQKGGPAFHISNVLKEENILFELITAPVMDIEILKTKDNEIGRVKTELKIQKIDFSKIKTPILVISTILNEFNLNGVSSFKGKVFLDVQGYVRDGSNFGGKKQFSPSKEIVSSIFCLKGTEEEIKYISSDFIEQQKQKIIIITKGSSGCEVFISGERFKLKTKKTVNAFETIGAGDTFFAYLISQFSRNNDFLKSVKYAMDQTSKFLTIKTI